MSRESVIVVTTPLVAGYEIVKVFFEPQKRLGSFDSLRKKSFDCQI